MNPHTDKPGTHSLGMAGREALSSIDSTLTPLVVITSVLLGAAAVVLLPREEEPQIKVPMVDVMVSVPGFTAKEVENRVTAPMEKLIWEIPGVEYVYSISRPEEALVIVRFLVGEDGMNLTWFRKAFLNGRPAAGSQPESHLNISVKLSPAVFSNKNGSRVQGVKGSREKASQISQHFIILFVPCPLGPSNSRPLGPLHS